MVIDICDYEEQKEGLGLSDIVQKGSSLISDAKEKVAEASDVVNEAGSVAEDVKNIGIVGIN